jgi:hypothetical protein
MTGTPELGVGICRMAVLSGHGHGTGGRRGRAATPGTPDGSTIDFDVAALGGIRNIEWLAGSGLAQAEIAAHDMISVQADRWPHPWSRRLLGHASTIAIATVIAITAVSKGSDQQTCWSASWRRGESNP